MTILLTLAAVASQTPVPVPEAAKPVQVIVDLTASAADCAGREVRAVTAVRPVPVAVTLAPGQPIVPFGFTFRIDESGRSLGITPEARPAPGFYFNPSDLQPALSATRFAPGAPHERCTIRFTAAATPIDQAQPNLLYRAFVLPHDRTYLDAVLMKRVRETSAGCLRDTAPKILLRAYPDYDRIAQPAGMVSLSISGFDIDASGKPTNVRTLVSDGNDALDAAARAAVARSRFGADARTGCTAPAVRRSSTVLTPIAAPEISSFRKADTDCGEDNTPWVLPPRMTFPEPFRRRGIEGWAIIRYDVAPWGQTGNVTVLASEPAAMFGEHARQIIMQAKRPPSARGATGCVDRVVFKLPENETADQEPPPPPPVF